MCKTGGPTGPWSVFFSVERSFRSFGPDQMDQNFNLTLSINCGPFTWSFGPFGHFGPFWPDEMDQKGPNFLT